jgi:MFS family permease
MRSKRGHSHVTSAFKVVIKAFKPKLQEDQPIANEADGAAPPSGPGILRSRQALADARFDLRVIRISLLCDTFSYIAMSFLSPAPVFIFFTALVTLGSCTGSAQSSLALNLVDPAREAGRLFGAMSVLTAMSSTFLGPLVFSLVYANTVAVYAPAIFIVAVGMLIISQVCISLVRLPKLEDSSDVEVPRGRTRRPKRVKSSASDRTAT